MIVEQQVVYQDTLLPPPDESSVMDDPNIPLQIREMMKLYEFGDCSFAQKCKNFYRQGKFMEDYEDHKLYEGKFRHYFTTYHDLNPEQLRGYFGWRALVRQGVFVPIATSMAFIYVYELLNGIGAESPEDALEKMAAFKIGFIDSGIGAPSMWKYLEKWMLEFAILHDLPLASVQDLIDQELLDMDEALLALKDPASHKPKDVYTAMLSLSSKNPTISPAVKKHGEDAAALFAEAWREALEQAKGSGKDLFKQCFGEVRQYVWRPLTNAVVWDGSPHSDCEYQIDECRKFVCKNGGWTQLCYASFYFDHKKFRSFYRGVDRLLRLHFKTGGYLKENPDEDWVAPIVEAAFKAVERKKIEEARQKVTIDVSHLARIREDADITKDSLLVEEEVEDSELIFEKPVGGSTVQNIEEISAVEGLTVVDEHPVISSLTPVQVSILKTLLGGDSISQMIKEQHLMASVVADSINETFFEEIGDNILESDGTQVTLVDDYIDDVAAMMGVSSE